jgi:hypothetical protein
MDPYESPKFGGPPNLGDRGGGGQSFDFSIEFLPPTGEILDTSYRRRVELDGHYLAFEACGDIPTGLGVGTSQSFRVFASDTVSQKLKPLNFWLEGVVHLAASTGGCAKKFLVKFPRKKIPKFGVNWGKGCLAHYSVISTPRVTEIWILTELKIL